MGSSKKAKDKDRDHKKKKKHRSSRSRSRSPVVERKERRERSRSRSPVHERREKRDRYSRSHSRSPSGRDRKRRDSPSTLIKDMKKELDSKAKESQQIELDSGGAAEESLSIEATNELRAKLGLKPLNVTKKEGTEDGDAENKSDVHKPAVNIGQQKKSELLREKVSQAREKRKIQTSLNKVRGLADSDSDDDAANWVKRQKKKEAEKKRAEERAKLLDQMDEEFGVSSLVEKEMKSNAPNYTSRDLRGLKVSHDVNRFKEGVTTVLTIADRGVLDEGDDELVNVNIQDQERLEKNISNKKAKPTYNPYEMEEDEYGMLKPKDVLSKYDEEITGPKKESSFQLGSRGNYDASQEKRMEQIRQELQKSSHTLEMPELTIQSEFLTQAEQDAKFKKRKRKVRKVKKSEMVKADDLLPLDEKEEDQSVAPAFSSDIMTQISEAAVQGNDDEEDYSGVNLDEDVVDDYQSSLALHRKLKQKKQLNPTEAAQRLLSEFGREETTDSKDFLTDEPTDAAADSVVLTATDEFCRNLGSMPTYGLSGNRQETERDELMDFEQELVAKAKAESDMEESDDEKGGWEQVEVKQERPFDLKDVLDPEATDQKPFEEDVVLDGGMAAALKLATQKGYMEVTTEKATGRTVKDPSKLLAKNYSIEDKKFDDIDDKMRKRNRGDRFGGPVQDFPEKKYIPDFKLSYQDDQGRELNQKEAFRVLSHKFHGKGSGKKKTEKRLKKLDEEKMMMSMSSTDTPLNTLARLKERQAKEKSAYVVLSGGSKTLTSSNSVVK